MQRIAFKMKLNEGQKKEYIKRHNDIWPELKLLLKESGIYEYSIFLDNETNSLFAIQNIKNGANSQDLGKTEIVTKWWKFMSDIMETNLDNSPVTINMEEVFHLE